jgi:predicted TIM-barrel fold metal-dependent hydrolase
MEIDHVDGSICFPNMFSRFCGQTFLDNPDRELGLACVRAYNDFILDEWCAGAGYGKLIPLTIVPLWDVSEAVLELERCAAKGTRAIAFSENPYHLGLPTIHSREWDPLFRACADADVTLTMHIGSSSKMPTTSPDAPLIVTSTTHFTVTVGSMLDFIFSGVLERIPNLKLFYAESQAGWMPFVLNQADWMWSRRLGAASDFGSKLPNPPSSYLKDHIWTSIFSDPVALDHRDRIGIDQICIETDYPHSDSTFPASRASVEKFCVDADLSEQERYKLVRGNAINAFSLHHLGIES